MLPFEMKEVDKFAVTIIMSSKTKYKHHVVEFYSLLEMTRFINTFQPRKPYEIVKIIVEKVRRFE